MTGSSSNNDKRRLVEVAVRANPTKSNREIAREIGVTHPFVARMRRRLETVLETITVSPAEMGSETPLRKPPGAQNGVRKIVSVQR